MRNAMKKKSISEPFHYKRLEINLGVEPRVKTVY